MAWHRYPFLGALSRCRGKPTVGNLIGGLAAPIFPYKTAMDVVVLSRGRSCLEGSFPSGKIKIPPPTLGRISIDRLWPLTSKGSYSVHPVNGEVPPVKGRPWKLPHYANRGKTSSSRGELASARSCFSTVRTALGKLRITGLLARFDVARSFPQFPRPLLLQPTIWTSERGADLGSGRCQPRPHLPIYRMTLLFQFGECRQPLGDRVTRWSVLTQFYAEHRNNMARWL